MEITHFEPNQTIIQSDILTLIVLKDANFALKEFREAAIEVASKSYGPQAIAIVNNITSKAYEVWGSKILQTIGNYIDLKKYGFDEEPQDLIKIDFHSGIKLAKATIEKGHELVSDRKKGSPVLFVSLDDMINPWAFKQYSHKHKDIYFGEIGFSRLFAETGENISSRSTKHGFIGRPGKKPLDEQLLLLLDQINGLYQSYGSKNSIPMVLLEDNVRHAKTLNWIIEKMDGAGIFKHSHLAGIATCLCSADEKERNAIKYNGNTIPVSVGMNYTGGKVDVVTPRDFLFAGGAVRIDNEEFGRLPYIFMSNPKYLADNLKIEKKQVEKLLTETSLINEEFCQTIKRELGIAPKLSWFVGGKAIANVMGVSLETDMSELISENAYRRKSSYTIKTSNIHGTPAPK